MTADNDATTVAACDGIAGSSGRTPMDTVHALFAALEDFDRAAFESLLCEDIDYTNVSLPTIHGRRRATRLFDVALGRLGWGFEVVVLNIAATGAAVLTERIDALVIGPFRFQFWVMGRMEIRDNRIAVWRDYFDYGNATIAVVRALVGALAPALRPSMPARCAPTATRTPGDPTC